MSENTPDQPSKFRTKNWVEINDQTRGTYIVNSQIVLMQIIQTKKQYLKIVLHLLTV